MQTNTYNVIKTWVLLQTTGGKDIVLISPFANRGYIFYCE